MRIFRSYRDPCTQLCPVQQTSPQCGPTNLLLSQQRLGTFSPVPMRQEGNSTMTHDIREKGTLIGAGDKGMDIPRCHMLC